MPENDSTGALTKIIEVLKPLTSEDRHRAVEAAMIFLGEKTTKAAEPDGKSQGKSMMMKLPTVNTRQRCTNG
jgi:hypothetical protein